jgi:hypothetical protein
MERNPFDPSDGNDAPVPSSEDMSPLDPRQPDSDGDGMLDVDERVLGRDPFDPSDGTESPGASSDDVDPWATGVDGGDSISGYEDPGSYDGYADAGIDDAAIDEAGIDMEA